MTDGMVWVAALLAGVGLGAFFFGVLRWTVGRALSSEHPVLWFVGSTVLRVSVVLTGFYAVGQGQWERFVLCGLGFVLAKFIVLAWNSLSSPAEVLDAP